MKIRVARQELQDGLAALSSLVGTRTAKPILACVKLTASGETLTLCATDGEASLRLAMPVLAVSRAGEVVVSVERLLGVVRELADIELAVETDERQCTIRGAGSEFKLFVQSVADFPPVPDFEGQPDLVLDGSELRRMIEWTLYAAAREVSRYAINGVLWDKHGHQLSLVATDGRRLAWAGGAAVSGQVADFDVIVPTKALGVFERVFVPPREGGEWSVQVRVTPNQLLLCAGGRVLSTVLVDGRFPKYEEVIPKDSDKRAWIDRAELHAAVRRAELLTTEDSRAVRLSFEADRLVVSARSPEQGEARVELPIEYGGDLLEIAFNPAFLRDALKVIPFERVQIELREPFRPGLLSGEDKGKFLYVIMPISVSP